MQVGSTSGSAYIYSYIYIYIYIYIYAMPYLACPGKLPDPNATLRER